ncbi:MAG: hypothetical protein DWQ08_01970 [Proteobacteria bacterium]|nr:MAG: hypothetical protein DWQ08_01970 [Pseudomonadota bacterium]
MTEAYTLTGYVDDLRRVARDTCDEDAILTRVGPLARRFAADGSWFDERYYRTDPKQGFGVHLLHEEQDHTLAILVVAWQPGGGTPPHDHGTWAVVAGIEGDETNVRYRRIDARDRPGYATLEPDDEFAAGPGDLVCMKNGGIHAVRNDTDAVTVSLHTYGMHVNFTDRCQYDTETGETKYFTVRIE